MLLAERHHGLREGLRTLLESAFEVVVMVADEASLIASARRLGPALAVVDLSLDRAGSLAWIARLREEAPGGKVIVLSVHDESGVARAVLAAGADAFVLKRSIASDLLPAVEAVLAGRSFQSEAHP